MVEAALRAVSGREEAQRVARVRMGSVAWERASSSDRVVRRVRRRARSRWAGAELNQSRRAGRPSRTMRSASEALSSRKERRISGWEGMGRSARAMGAG